jgi:hypothetical protein
MDNLVFNLKSAVLVILAYIECRPGPEKHSIVTTGFKLVEIDQKEPME